ncbi:MAG: SPFH/Band 7/PHB domain protein [Persephonella sp.]|nr:MAG: SPFH/Band 7/PHB domain protein [Persephonella sp.]
MEYLYPLFVIIFVIILVISILSIKVVPHKEAWIIERLGKFHKVAESGINFIFPILDTVKAKLSLKEQVLDVPKQDVITKDNVVVEVDALCYYKIIIPEKAFYNIEDLESAIEQTIQTAVRDVVGTFSLDDLLSAREEINERVKEQLDEISKEWGIIIHRVELKEINPPPDIIEAMTKLIEADRTKKAMITEAEGKKKAIELEAEAFKFKKIKEAEALKEFGEAQAVAVQKLISLVGDPQLATLLIVGDSYLNALKDMSTTESSKMVILPPNIESLIDMLNRRRGNDGGNTS